MKNVIAYFAARRYWTDNSQLIEAVDSFDFGSGTLITCEADLDGLESGDCLTIIPMSGALQQLIIKAAKNYSIKIIYAAYIRGNVKDNVANDMLLKNAAPAFMDCWAVLRRLGGTLCALNPRELELSLRIADAYCYIKAARLIRKGTCRTQLHVRLDDLNHYIKTALGCHQVFAFGDITNEMTVLAELFDLEII